MTDLAGTVVENRLGETRTIDDLTTLFDLCLIAADARRPEQLAQLGPVVDRIHHHFGEADCTVGILVVGADAADARRAVGERAERIAIYADPQGRAGDALGLTGTPSLVWVSPAPRLEAVVHGWDPQQWRLVLDELAGRLAWSRAEIPARGDPGPIPPQPLSRAVTARGAGASR